MNRDHPHDLDASDGRGGHDSTAQVKAQVEAQVEAQLRTALALEARSIHPEDRLDVILAATRDAVTLTSTRARSSAHRRLAAAGAAAAAALVVTAVWAVDRPFDGPATPGPVSTSATPTTPGGASGTSSPRSTTSPPTSSGMPATSGGHATGPALAPSQAATLAVFRVGVLDGTGGRLGLVREPVPAGPDAAGTPSERALAAAMLSVDDSTATFDSGYRPLWAGTRVTNVDVGPDLIRVTLTHGARGLSGTDATLAVQQLVWTVQSAVSPSNRQPVRFTLSDGSTALAGNLTTASTYTRPTDVATLDAILAPLWIDQPYPRQILSAGAPVAVTGEASTVDGRLEWTLARGGAPVASGSVTAAVPAPARGPFAFGSGPLDRGDYSITVLARSPRDGSVTAQWQIPFSVR